MEVAWLSYFLRVIVLWLRPRVESFPAVSNTKETQRVLAQRDLALIISTGVYNVASTKNREFPMQVLTLKEPDVFFPKVA